MKEKRHEKIIELIEQYDIETQDELADRLRAAGFQVTQATVSRDIRKLKLSKVPGRNGRQKYALLTGQNHQMSEKYVGILREAFVSMDAAQNILVIKTVSGMAMALATALDNIDWKEILGLRGRRRHRDVCYPDPGRYCCSNGGTEENCGGSVIRREANAAASACEKSCPDPGD